ncbi:DUF6528 family protein [Microbacterium sp. KUDC0406]|uniref:DUF6528 family protein n=1 Tax=Microbacterium sp. KUDC0406 TaxID=2909588 RepID=UPI001F3B9B3F|nr:DUF6528 family protein [Microbacterium sp. KUDC0406]UJP09596.1 DUF6528 family protein [Microbacterium sp. KUDC0406]
MTPSDRSMLVTDQAGAHVVLTDEVGLVLREWRVDGDPAWGLPNEAKAVGWSGERMLLVTDSRGFTGLFTWDGDLRWRVDEGPDANPHSAELLSDGRVAVASSDGGTVRVHRGVGQGDADEQGGLIAEAALHDAHGLAWDPARGGLWALGGRWLVHWSWQSGIAALHETFRTELPSAHGHDLAWERGQHPDRLWVTTDYGVHSFDVRRRQWLPPEPVCLRSARGVKSIGRSAAGDVLYTQADEEWWTDSLNILTEESSRENGRPERVRLAGMRIYKARWAEGDR